MKILKCSLMVIALAGCFSCIDIDGAKQDIIDEVNEKFLICEEKLDVLAERLAYCETVLEE